jgi:hypothetical protein
MLKKIYFIIIAITASAIILSPASAQILTNTSGEGSLTGMANTVGQTAQYSNVEIGTIVAVIIQVLLGLLGIIFLGLVISAGFRWMTANGNEEQVKQATGTLKTAIIGLLIVLMAYGITYFVFNKLPFSGGSDNGGTIR